jgi:nucleolar protein 14
MGGSQLKQLKAAISTSGISNQQSNSRKRKRGASDSAGKGAVLEHRDKRVEKLREIHEKFNPFDVKVERVKHDVGGRKMKGTMGKPGASKQAGIEQVRRSFLLGYTI